MTNPREMIEALEKRMRRLSKQDRKDGDGLVAARQEYWADELAKILASLPQPAQASVPVYRDAEMAAEHKAMIAAAQPTEKSHD
jgi:hypothetical protein